MCLIWDLRQGAGLSARSPPLFSLVCVVRRRRGLRRPSLPSQAARPEIRENDNDLEDMDPNKLLGWHTRKIPWLRDLDGDVPWCQVVLSNPLTPATGREPLGTI